MATKQQWREYFKLLNDREPSLEEFQEAVNKGEIDDVTIESVKAVLPGQSSSVSALSGQSVQADVEPTRPQVTQSPIEPFLPRPENTARATSDHHVGIWEAYLLFWKNYVNFTGRSRRSEYWWVFLINSVIGFILVIPGLVVLFASLFSTLNSYSYSSGYSYNSGSVAGIIGGVVLTFIPLILYGLATIVPTIALFFRRLRDAGLGTMNGVAFYVFLIVLRILGIIPFLGIIFDLAVIALAIYEIIVCVRESDYYQNRPEPITDWFGKLFNHR